MTVFRFWLLLKQLFAQVSGQAFQFMSCASGGHEVMGMWVAGMWCGSPMQSGTCSLQHRKHTPARLELKGTDESAYPLLQQLGVALALEQERDELRVAFGLLMVQVELRLLEQEAGANAANLQQSKSDPI